MPITAVVVDDDHKPRALLIKALNQYFPNVRVAEEANSVEAAVQAIRAHKPDLVFLDVDLTYGTGFDVLEMLSAPDDPEFAVIFVTAFEEYAVKAIEYSAVGYVVKPINAEEFRRKVQKTLERLFSEQERMQTPSQTQSQNSDQPAQSVTTPTTATSSSTPSPTPQHMATLAATPATTLAAKPFVNPLADKIALPSSKGKQLVVLADVLYCEAQSNYTDFHLANGATITVAKTLKDCEEQLLPKGFFRIHRSHLINLAHLKELVRDGNSLYVRLAGVSHSIAVARMYHESLLDLLP